MAHKVTKIVRQGVALGNRGLWVAVDMSWALEPNISSTQLSEWEASWNDLILGMPVVLLCQYHEQKFPHDFLHPQFLTHPFIVRQGRIYSNFYYNPSEILSGRGSGHGQLIVG
jgi:hypothetical protein